MPTLRNGENFSDKTGKVSALRKLTSKLGRQKIKKQKKKKILKVCCNIYGKTIKGDTIKHNWTVRQKLDGKPVCEESKESGKDSL